SEPAVDRAARRNRKSRPPDSVARLDTPRCGVDQEGCAALVLDPESPVLAQRHRTEEHVLYITLPLRVAPVVIDPERPQRFTPGFGIGSEVATHLIETRDEPVRDLRVTNAFVHH